MILDDEVEEAVELVKVDFVPVEQACIAWLIWVACFGDHGDCG